MIDDGRFSDDFHLKYVIQAFRDWKIWVNMFITIGLFTSLYSISLFLPTIIKELGYSANASQLMTVPVYVVACFCTICGSLASDRVGQRGLFLIGFELIAIAGFTMLISSGKPQVQYAGTFFAASGKSRFIFNRLTLIIILHKHLPTCSADWRLEQQQHRWKSQARRWYCHAGGVWQSRRCDCRIRLSFYGSA